MSYLLLLKSKLTSKKIYLILCFFILARPLLFANTYTVTSSANWSTCGDFSSTPTSADIINVKGGAILTVDVNNAVANYIQLGLNGASAGHGTLAFNSGAILTLGSTGTLTLGTSSSKTGTLDMTLGGKLILKNFATPAGTAVFTPGIGTVEFISTVTIPSATISCLATFNNLNINGSGITVTTNSAITVGGALTMTSGNLTLGSTMSVTGSVAFTSGYVTSTSSNLLSLGTSATVSGASDASHVIGPMAKNTNSTSIFTFPIGDGTYYRSCAVTPQGTGATTYQAQYTYAKYSVTTVTGANIDHVSQIEYWTIDRSGASPQDCYLTLSYDSKSKADANYADLIVAHYTGAAWETTGNATITGNSTAGTVLTNSYWGSFSPFTLASKTSNNALALPISLINFSVKIENNITKSTWQTINEVNNNYFNLERSSDGIHFTDIGKIAGSGTTNQLSSYVFYDYRPLNGISYYRLKQTDFDSTSTYSKILILNNDKIMSIAVYPNPSNASISVNIPLDKKFTYNIYNISGEIIYESIILDTNNELNISTLSSGKYILIALENNYPIASIEFIKN